MTTISIEDVKRLAQLSALDISDDEATQLQKQLVEILDYVVQLNDVDTSGLEPTYQVGGLENVMRADKVVDYGVNHEALMKNVPEQTNGQIKVRKVL